MIGRTSEPVLILDPGAKVSYANLPSAKLLGKEPHHIEGKALEDVLFSPALMEAVEKARHGDIEETGVDVTLESADGQVHTVHVLLGAVHDRGGEVSRVVLVVQDNA